MTSTQKAIGLLLALCFVCFGQSAPFKGGLLTNESAQLPVELATCGKVAYIGMNASEAFVVGRTCAGAIRIWRKVNNGSFNAVVSESEFGQYKLLASMLPLTGQDWYSLPDIEVRPDGLHFTLMSVQPGGFTFDSGSGGSYRITSGKLEKFLGPGDTFSYTDTQGVRRTATATFTSLPFTQGGNGELVFVKTTSQGVVTEGIFRKKDGQWTLVLRFLPTPAPEIKSPLGIGQPISTYGITETVDGSVFFLQRWNDGTGTKLEWVKFDPRNQSITLLYRYGTPILGANIEGPAPLRSVDTGTRYWRGASGQFGNRTDYLVKAPIPEFPSSWKWQISAPGVYGIDLRGMSDNIAMYLSAKVSTDRGVIASVWDGQKLDAIVSNGDTLPGRTITKVGNSFTNFNSWLPVSGCTALIGTYKADDTVESLWRFEKPCITDSVVSGGQVFLNGKNLSFAGYTPTVLVNGSPVSGVVATPEQVRFPQGSLPGGNHKVQVTMANGAMYSNETTVSVPVTVPVPTISGITNAANQLNVPVAAGGLFTIYGSNLATVADTGTGSPGILIRAFGTPLPQKLGGSRVFVDGLPVPLVYAANTTDGKSQINAQMPNGVLGPTAKVLVQRCVDINCFAVEASVEATIQVLRVSPAMFTNPKGIPKAQIFNNANQLVEDTPAKGGDILVFYGTGCGPSNPQVPEGLSSRDISTDIANITSPVAGWLKYTFGGETQHWSIEILGAAASPDYAGLCQVNVRLPGINPDPGTKVYTLIQVGDRDFPPLELPYTAN